MESLTISSTLLIGCESSTENSFGELSTYSEAQIRSFVSYLTVSLQYLDLDECSTAIFKCLLSLFAAGPLPPTLKRINIIFSVGQPTEPYIDSQNRELQEWINMEKLAQRNGVELTRNKTTHARQRSRNAVLGTECRASFMDALSKVPYNFAGTPLKMDMWQESTLVSRKKSDARRRLRLRRDLGLV